MKDKAVRTGKGAVVLLSGGLDSAVTLYLAKDAGFDCACLGFDYGQRHKKEIEAARKIARAAGAEYRTIKFDFPWKGSSLLDKNAAVPQRVVGQTGKRANAIPSTYVPGRNIVFLSSALSFAEARGAGAVYIGAHAQDYSGYPDCRPEFFRAFQKASDKGTKAGVNGRGIRIRTPLINKTKAQIIAIGGKLGVPFELTWSCYRGQDRPCGKCDSCFYRAKGFKEAGLKDPALKK